MDVLRDQARGLLGLTLTDAQLATFEAYYREVVDWNTRVNLTSITGYVDFQVKHLLDSLTCILALPAGASAAAEWRAVDIGAGAGLPGIPLKIVFPEWQLTLLDAVGKKVRFLEHVAGVLGLTGATAVHARAEDLGRDAAHREQYDLALARAVADLPVLAEYALPLVRIGGVFVAQKGRDAGEEAARALPAFKQLGGALDGVIAVPLPGLDEPRHLVRIAKVSSTPDRYPRRAGTPEKRPLA